MNLTDDQVAQETSWIREEPRWPLWPLLPVKNIHRGDAGFEGPEIGVMVAGRLEPCIVYAINLLDLKAGPLNDQLNGKETLTFATVEEAVRAGWIGD